MYRHDFKDRGLLDARVGYIGGDTKDPSYRAVCSGRTGRESFFSFSDPSLLLGRRLGVLTCGFPNFRRRSVSNRL